ncbi:MAG: hypothetical protein K6T78_15680 [Alicyclobacillus sp.]|nr:hypothetical protein [Alicyclobacillus sp.]
MPGRHAVRRRQVFPCDHVVLQRDIRREVPARGRIERWGGWMQPSFRRSICRRQCRITLSCVFDTVVVRHVDPSIPSIVFIPS